MEYKVEKGLKIPEYKNSSKKYPILKVGESFFVPCTDEDKQRIQNNLSTGSRYRREGKYTVRRVDGGIRIWRIE